MRWTLEYLSWHDFSIGAADIHAGVQTRSVMGFHDIPAVRFISSYSTVIWSWKEPRNTVNTTTGVERNV